jgi:hypothetical protein
MKITKKMREARVNRAVVGFQIPMLSLVKLGKELDAAIVAGKSDDELKAIVAAFPGVNKARSFYGPDNVYYDAAGTKYPGR